jgi:hypothetical protein
MVDYSPGGGPSSVTALIIEKIRLYCHGVDLGR